MRVMGVDPGLTRCGMALVETGKGRHVVALDVDVVRTPAEDPLELRLRAIYEAAGEWMDVHGPAVLAIERVFAQNQRSTAMGTAQAAGVVALAASFRDIPVAFRTPSEVKAAITGNGRADKAQVTAMVTRILGLQKPPKPADAADALALAICHSWRAPSQAAVSGGEVAGGDFLSGYEAKVAAALARDKRSAGGAGSSGTASGPAAAGESGTRASSAVRQRPSNKIRRAPGA